MKITLSGEVVSDALEDNRVVSGVGGQYNFVAMAHQHTTGRSVVMFRATRENITLVVIGHWLATVVLVQNEDLVGDRISLSFHGRVG